MKTKTTLCPTLDYDAKGIEKVLSEMSRKGWVLKKTGLLWKYEEAVPKERAFSVTFTRPEENWMEMGDSEELRNIVEYSENLGWQLISSHKDRKYNTISIFMNDDPEAVPLETDFSVQLINTRNTMGKTIASWTIYTIWISVIPFMNYFLYSDFPGMDKYIWLSIGILSIFLAMVEAAGYLLWLISAKKAVSMGRGIPDMLKYTKLFKALTVIILVLMVTAIACMEYGPLALLILSVCGLGFTIAGLIISKITDQTSKGKRIAITAAALIFAMAATFILLYSLAM
jgi:hypothetical protein